MVLIVHKQAQSLHASFWEEWAETAEAEKNLKKVKSQSQSAQWTYEKNI